MVKVLLQLYPMIPASEEEREALRPIGRNRELYQETIRGWTDIIKAADEMGLWGVATIEHHFWSEGYEVGPCPALLNAYWAPFTKNVRVGQLGYVMSCQNPVRVAEETAILDHLTQGRCFVGFARGYQSRWTNILGQHLGARATLSPSVAKVDPNHLFGGALNKKDLSDDERNRMIFEEQVDIVLKAWTQESIEVNGNCWKIPYPYETGVDDWPPAKMGTTQRFGAHGEVDADGNIRRVSVVPSPYTRPHPPVFVATSGSPESAEFAAQKGFIPLYFTPISTAQQLGKVYQKVANAQGQNLPSGKNQALVRMPHIKPTREAAEQAALRCDGDIFRNFYATMGRKKVERNEVIPALTNHGLWSIGTPDEVRKRFIDEWKALPCEYVTLIYHYAQMPKDEVIENLESFMRHVKPALDELTAYTDETQTEADAR